MDRFFQSNVLEGAEPGDDVIEKQIEEAIEFFRKRRRVSNDKSISERIVSLLPTVSVEAVAYQIQKSVQSGKVKKVNQSRFYDQGPML